MIIDKAGRWFIIEKDMSVDARSDSFAFREIIVEPEEVGTEFGDHVHYAKHFEANEDITGFFTFVTLCRIPIDPADWRIQTGSGEA